MATILEKIAAEEHNERTIRLWPEGSFYKAYERSAYLFVTQLRPYSVRSRYVQAAGRDVLSTGFPQSVLGSLGKRFDKATDGAVVITVDAPVDEQAVLRWRDQHRGQTPVLSVPCAVEQQKQHKGQPPVLIPEQSSPSRSLSVTCAVEQVVASRIRQTNLAAVTPMECMLLLSELQTMLANGESASESTSGTLAYQRASVTLANRDKKGLKP